MINLNILLVIFLIVLLSEGNNSIKNINCNHRYFSPMWLLDSMTAWSIRSFPVASKFACCRNVFCCYSYCKEYCAYFI